MKLNLLKRSSATEDTTVYHGLMVQLHNNELGILMWLRFMIRLQKFVLITLWHCHFTDGVQVFYLWKTNNRQTWMARSTQISWQETASREKNLQRREDGKIWSLATLTALFSSVSSLIYYLHSFIDALNNSPYFFIIIIYYFKKIVQCQILFWCLYSVLVW